MGRALMVKNELAHSAPSGSADFATFAPSLRVNMSETLLPLEFTEQGE